jgi:competence protein ComGC
MRHLIELIKKHRGLTIVEYIVSTLLISPCISNIVPILCKESTTCLAKEFKNGRCVWRFSPENVANVHLLARVSI